MSDQPSDISITVSPSQVGGWNAMTVLFRDEDTGDVLRTIEGGNLPVPAVGETVSFGNVETVSETPEAAPETHVDMETADYEVVDREFTYVYQGPADSAESSDVEVTIDVSLRERE